MKYSKTCDHCDHQNTAYTNNLNAQMVGALKQLVEFYETKKKKCNLQENLRLTHNQFANFQKLQYFGLARRDKEGWLPTNDGIEFIYGSVCITVPVAVMNGEILPDDHEAWDTHAGERHQVFVFDIDETAYKKRPEYAKERNQSTLFEN